MFAHRTSNASKTTTFEGGTGSHGRKLKDGSLLEPPTDKKVAQAVITATQERIDIKAETVEESIVSHEIQAGNIELEDYGMDNGSEASDLDSLDGATVVDANGPVDDTPRKTGAVTQVTASSKLVVLGGIKFTKRRNK